MKKYTVNVIREYSRPATLHRIFETNSSFHVKQRTEGKIQFLFFKSFLLALIKFSFWQKEWVLGYIQSFGNSYVNVIKTIQRLRFAENYKNLSNLQMDWQTKSYDISSLLFVYGSCAKIPAKFKYCDYFIMDGLTKVLFLVR